MIMDPATRRALVEALRNDPEFREDLRRQLLTAELLELPEKFAQFVAATEQRFTKLETALTDFIAATEQRFARLETALADFVAATEQRFARLETALADFITATEQRFARLETALSQFAEQTNLRLQALEEAQTRIQNDVAELKSDMTEVKSDVAELKSDMTEVKSDVAELKTETRRTNGRLDNGFGTNYEIKVANNFGSLAGQFLRLQRIQVLKAAMFRPDANLTELIADAEDEARITPDQANELLAADLIAVGRSRADRRAIYVAAEVSISISHNDVHRAAARAQHLAQATGQPAVPAVVGERIDHAHEALARRRNVTVMRLPSG